MLASASGLRVPKRPGRRRQLQTCRLRPEIVLHRDSSHWTNSKDVLVDLCVVRNQRPRSEIQRGNSSYISSTVSPSLVCYRRWMLNSISKWKHSRVRVHVGSGIRLAWRVKTAVREPLAGQRVGTFLEVYDAHFELEAATLLAP